MEHLQVSQQTVLLTRSLLELAVVKVAEEANTKVEADLDTVEVVTETVADIKAMAAFWAVVMTTTMYNNHGGRDQGYYYGNQGSYYGGSSQGSYYQSNGNGNIINA